MKKLSIVLLVLLVFGCAHMEDLNRRIQNPERKSSSNEPSIKEMMDSWKGHHISEVIRRGGPADQVVSDEAGGRIYIWVSQEQRRIPKYRWVTEQPRTRNVPSPSFPQLQSQPQRTTTDGTMRWNPLLKQWEYKSETRTDSGLKLPNISGDLARILNDEQPRSRLKVEYETRTNTQRIMLYTRSDGTIYHYLID